MSETKWYSRPAATCPIALENTPSRASALMLQALLFRNCRLTWCTRLLPRSTNVNSAPCASSGSSASTVIEQSSRTKQYRACRIAHALS